jgi:hypothetical protein
MAAELAVSSGTSTIVLDIRRGDGAAGCFHYTMSVLAATDRLVQQSPDIAAAKLRAVVATQKALKQDTRHHCPQQAFPTARGSDVVRRDLPYYQAAITPAFVAGCTRWHRWLEEDRRRTGLSYSSALPQELRHASPTQWPLHGALRINGRRVRGMSAFWVVAKQFGAALMGAEPSGCSWPKNEPAARERRW